MRIVKIVEPSTKYSQNGLEIKSMYLFILTNPGRNECPKCFHIDWLLNIRPAYLEGLVNNFYSY